MKGVINFNTKDWEIVLKALANRRRLEILGFLKKAGEVTVGEIAEHINLSFKSTSRHLGILAYADVLNREQRGPEAYYRISIKQDDNIKKLLKIIIQL